MLFHLIVMEIENMLLMQDNIFTNLFSLKAGQYMLINRNGFVIKPLFSSGCAIYKCSPHYCEVIKDLLLPSVRATLSIDSSQKSLSTSDIISSVKYDTDLPSDVIFEKIIKNPNSPLTALFDAKKLDKLTKSEQPSDAILREHLIKINYLFENYKVRMI